MAAALESTRPVSRACVFCDGPPRYDGRCVGCGKALRTAARRPSRKKSARPAPAVHVAADPVPVAVAALPSPAALPAYRAPAVALAPVAVASTAVPATDRRPLVEKYRPRDLSGVAGQSWIVHQLRAWLEAPQSAAFLFSGGTGCGKSSTAAALAHELGCNVADEYFGGMFQIASGEQDGQSVRKALGRLHLSAPTSRSGWKVLIVNECDILSAGAAAVWLDALENLPPRACIVFTTNAPARLPQRLRDRCETFHFESSALMLQVDLQDFAARVWTAETGRTDCPELADLGSVADENGDASFRRLLQLMESAVRAARAGLPFKRRNA